ncbi:hypothetical protein [Nocardia sp. NPDC057440]|uniref:hypothetical protein n=1 Tax=Nocardia sp. NPDC057440 TaxID=3346134 RepID=UPI0036712BC9
MKTIVATLAISAAALAGCESTGNPVAVTTTPPLPTRTTTTAPATKPSLPTAPAVAPTPHGRCNLVPDHILARINNAFADRSHQLGTPYALDGADGLVWVGGNIMQGDTKVSSADVWVVSGFTIYALSGDARRRTALPDGRHVLDVSAGDDDGIAVQACVTGP